MIDNYTIQNLNDFAIELLKRLISIESFSTLENKTADLIQQFLATHKISTKRLTNNVYCFNEHFDIKKQSILLNSHHDTVKPNSKYTNYPFDPIIQDGKIYGLGSTDAGASLVALTSTFLHFYSKSDLPYNIILALTGEEEISGANGVESILKFLPNNIYCGIVGEPTQMNMAIAERGLLVIDCVADGITGHAAREEGLNPINIAIEDINWINNYKFSKISDYIGENKMSVTIINAGNQHNVIPAVCNFTIDVRLNDLYTHEEVIDIISKNLKSKITPRSTRLKSTFISEEHPLIKAGLKLGKKTFGSPTTSDKSLMPFPTLKCGPGNSQQSHTANEFVLIQDIKNGITDYINLLNTFFNI